MEILQGFIYFFVFLFGLIGGSFLNSFLCRFNLPVNIRKSKRSFCPHCQHLLSWKDLIPLLSFVILRGRCRYCKKPISLQYPLVELATGVLFLLITNLTCKAGSCILPLLSFTPFSPSVPSVPFSFFSLSSPSSPFSLFSLFSLPPLFSLLHFLYLLTITSFLIIIFVFDLKYFVIPDRIIYPAIVITLLYRLFETLKFGINSQLLSFLAIPLLSAFGAALFFLTIFLISGGKWLGFGDVKLAFFMGLFLGFPNILVALFFAFSIGAIIGIGLIVFKKKKLKSEVPFGPFLVTGTFIALFWGEEIINWYLSISNFIFFQ